MRFVPIDESEAAVIRFEESRACLMTLGIPGEIIPTPSHSEDSVSVMLDDGDCIVGDLQPMEFLDGYENSALQADWNRIAGYHPKRILYAHRPEKRVQP